MKNFIEVGKTHDEQEQQIKQWIKDNGMQIIAGVVLGLGGIWGMGAYQQYQDEQAANARTLYLSIANSPLNAQVFDQLSNEHTDSGYLEQAGFILAKAAVNNKDYNKALEHLRPISASSDVINADIAKLRMAAIHLELGNFDQSLELLKTSNDKFSGLYAQLMGDVYLASGKVADAKKHYQLALSQISKDSELQSFINIKLNDLN